MDVTFCTYNLWTIHLFAHLMKTVGYFDMMIVNIFCSKGQYML